MKKITLGLLVLFANQCFGMNWDEIFDDYKTILSNESILQEQHQAYVLSQAPSIAE